MPATAVEVSWQIAEDEAFSRVVRSGTVTANPDGALGLRRTDGPSAGPLVLVPIQSHRRNKSQESHSDDPCSKHLGQPENQSLHLLCADVRVEWMDRLYALERRCLRVEPCDDQQIVREDRADPYHYAGGAKDFLRKFGRKRLMLAGEACEGAGCDSQLASQLVLRFP